MLSVHDLVIIFVVLLLLQFILSGGFFSFLIIARRQDEKVFPRGKIGSTLPRYMHRRRLELIIAILAMELIVLFLLPIVVFGFYSSNMASGISFLSGIVLILISAVLVVVDAVLAFGLASRRPETFAFYSSFLLLPIYFIFRPLSFVIIYMTSRLFPDLSREFASSLFFFEDEEPHEGFIEENGSKLMHSIVEFGVKKVREVMVPRIDVFALEVSIPCDEARKRVSEVGHSRVPVYEGNIDKIVGILYVKDLLKLDPKDYERVTLEQIARDAYFVPESKKIDDLLREFQREKKHMAIVVDEYGGTSGIVTLEDILEEIVGDIRDEYDQEKPLIKSISEGEYLVDGRINLEELQDETGIVLDSEDVDTLGGFIFNLIQRVPEEGEELEYRGMKFLIKRLEGQRIKDVLIRLSQERKDEG